MTLEDDILETSGDAEKAPSVSETDISTEATAEPVDVNTIQTDADPAKTEKDPKNPFENDEEIVDDPEQTEPSETQPLNAGPEGRGTKAASVRKNNGDIEGDLEEEIVSTDDLDSPAHKKKSWDCRCVIIGILVLVIMVGGAAVAILAQRFKSPNYNFRFASYYGDHMVLQRAPQKAMVWGYGPIINDNTTVKVKLVKEEGGDNNLEEPKELEFFTIIKNNEGRGIWKVLLGPISQPGPYTLTAILVGQEGHLQTIHDVLFGDVWMCAGEGNMQYSVGQLQNAAEEIAAAEKYQSIRLFSASPAESDIPWYDLRGIQLHWSRPSRETLIGRTIPASQLSSFFPAVCWLYGKQLQERLQYPIGLVAATYNGSMLEEWTSQGVLDECGYTYNPVKSHSTSRVWNAMLHPLLDISVYGALWYQGESDAFEMSRNYNCTLVKMFGEWREKAFHRTLGATDPNFPIGTVQLAPNRPDNHLTYGFTDIRWKQTANYGFTPNPLLKKIFMAVAMDLPDINGTFGSMYSTYKQEMVNRLVKGALAIAYQQKNATFQGPFPTRYSAKRSGHSLTLYLTPNAHLETRSNDGFEVCCSEDRKLFCPSSYIKTTYAPGREWVPAVITSHDSSSVTMSWAGCEEKHVVGIRYAWRETPCELRQCAIYDAFTTLPMPPYIKLGLMDDGATHELPEEQVNLI